MEFPDPNVVYEILKFAKNLNAHFSWEVDIKPEFFKGVNDESGKYYGLIAEADKLIEGHELYPLNHEKAGEVRKYRLTQDGYLVLELGSYEKWVEFSKVNREYISNTPKREEEVRESIIFTNKWSFRGIGISAILGLISTGAIVIQANLMCNESELKSRQDSIQVQIIQEVKKIHESIDSLQKSDRVSKIQLSDSINVY